MMSRLDLPGGLPTLGGVDAAVRQSWHMSVFVGRGLLIAGLVLASQVAAAGATIDDRLAGIQMQLAATVASFNVHMRKLDVQAPDTVAAFNQYIDKQIAPHWHAGLMARQLLGESEFDALSGLEQSAVRQALTITFYRYTYEILEEYRRGPMVLGDTFEATKNGWQRIKLKAKPRLLPSLTGDVYIALYEDDWAIVDAGMAAFTYISLKRGSYRRQFAKGGAQGVVAWLDEKNSRFFADYCEPAIRAVMPGPINALCVEG